MTLRTEGDLVWAANASEDLHGLCINFLVNYRKHCNGVNDIKITDKAFVVVVVGVCGTVDNPQIEFAIISTETSTWQTTDYHSPDSDYYSEAWGSDNSCGYTLHSRDYQKEYRIKISTSSLLMPQDKQVEAMKRWKQEWTASLAEKERLRKISELEKQLEKLK